LTVTPLDTKEVESITVLLMRGFYSMVFQPILHTSSVTPLGFEALLRGPVGTPLAAPGRLFNQEGYIDVELLSRLDMACIGSALRTGRMLASEGLLFVNIHGHTVPHFSPDAFLKLLDDTGIDPGQVVFELSERTNQDHVREIAKKLREFRRWGVKLALDDVGSRYPWLMHMLWLEPEFVKADRNLIQGVDTHPRKQDLLEGLTIFSKKMGARLIAEGVETNREYSALTEVGVPLVQGFLLGRPKTAEHWLKPENGYTTQSPDSTVSPVFPGNQ
jgi:EAL domain-containing protein (putative c-di-GMP-specific phosphodiesterase class I)